MTDTVAPSSDAEPRHPARWTGKSFIEVQFPVSKLSKESYKERTAVQTQTLTGLGKWWGRKPLVLVRATILGLLLPATDDPQADREVFFALMTMDNDGLLHRRRSSLSTQTAYEALLPHERASAFTMVKDKLRWKTGLKAEDRARFQRRAFLRLGYDDQIKHCLRVDELDGPPEALWERINTHLGTSATNLSELIRELGIRRFGHTPRVADPFCGGGSIPFEAARIGCEAYGSDLNPVAALLTWGALNVVGGGEAAVERVREVQESVYEAVKAQVEEWRIERNEAGWVADAYLYCNEVLDPATGWRVPLAPSWVIATKTNVIARLIPVPAAKRFEIEIVEQATAKEIEEAAHEGTWADGVRCPVDPDGNWLPPHQRQTTSMEQLKGRSGLRSWENEDIVPRPDDVFRERLYCIRWVETVYDPMTDRTEKLRHYRALTDTDQGREQQVRELLHERFIDWQVKGYIPSAKVEPGVDNHRPSYARGWSHWHHFFCPRQLLLNGLFLSISAHQSGPGVAFMLMLAGRLANWNSRMSAWTPGGAGGAGVGQQTFYKPSLYSPQVSFVSRSATSLSSIALSTVRTYTIRGEAEIELRDARSVIREADLWITDPGYGDTVPYDELSEFFLSWYEARLPAIFPGWYSDSRRALAVKGKADSFRRSMVECYRRFTELMPDDGIQVVMFTHQDAEVWSDLALVLWAAGLQVAAAWTIATETSSGAARQGNYVQGTVLLVLRKRQGDEWGDFAEIFPRVRREVERQLATMQGLDPKEDPNFGDADYQLAAYAAALRVATGYAQIGEIDVERELARERRSGERSPLAPLIEQAVRVASDFLVPNGLSREVWQRLLPEERLYLKGLDVEVHGEMRAGVYQELARGLGVGEYRLLLASGTANQVRLKTPTEFGRRNLDARVAEGSGVEAVRFSGGLMRKVLYAIYVAGRASEGGARSARQYLKDELGESYWDRRQTVISLLDYLAAHPAGLAHWASDAEAARVLHGLVMNESV